MEYLIVLLLNTLLAILFFVLVKDKNQRIFSLFFIVLPIFGFMFYFVPKFLFQITKKHNLFDISNVKLEVNQETISKKPNVSTEMNVVSFNEIMQVGLKEEKRAILLNVIKDNMVKNASFIRSAMGDSDSETTHYAASATMQIYTKLRSTIQGLETQVQLDPSNGSMMIELLSAISDYIESGVLTKRDRDFYCNKYSRVFEQLKLHDPLLLTSDSYLKQADFLFLSQDVHKSIEIAIEGRDRFDTEENHLKLLELLYKTGNQTKFNEAFEAFKHSGLTVSSKGLELIRFWNKRST